jgi:hypothetical protein
MKPLQQLLFICLLVLSLHLHAETQTVNDVEFTCSATPKQNINGVPVASLVEVLVKVKL